MNIRHWLFLLLSTLGTAVWAAALPPLDELHGTMDRAALEAHIERVEAAGPPADDPQRLKHLGIAWHNLAALGVDGASKQAGAWLEQAQQALPDDAEVMAYLGSARTLAARDSWNVMAKARLMGEGRELLDGAVRKAPKNAAVRLVRANNSLSLPEFLGRRPTAQVDLGYLHRHGETLGLRPATAAEVCVKLGELLLEEGDTEAAQALFAEASALAPGSPWAARARN